MLARHLLFIATRLHHNTILAIDSVPPHGIVQPPPYISPPKPEECQRKEKIQKDPGSQLIQNRCEKQQNCGQQAVVHHEKTYARDPRQNIYDNNKYAERNDLQRVCDQRQMVYVRNARNQQCYGKNAAGQQFYTLPSRRPQRDVEPPRSVTPDITRGLGRGSFSSGVHMLARQRTMMDQDLNRYGGSQVDLNRRNLECFDSGNGRNQTPIVDIRNRFATPLGLTALGYRFFASSPIRDPVTKSPSADALKYNPISPIGHGYGNSFNPSTPAAVRTMTTVAGERSPNNNNNCPSAPNSGRSTPVQNSSGRSTPTNLILSPTKSTMSNEELFAAIHKSKKRLNIKDDNENLSPYGSTNSLAKITPGSRNSWTVESQKMVTQNAQPPPPATSRLDFKRLLLQQSVKTGPVRLSAAEQLKLSRQQCQQQQSSPGVQQTSSLAKVLSPRSIWRFQTPRTDVLSSTIIEDTAAEEKAMKPSPENASPVSRINARRQLDLNSENDSIFDPSDDRLAPSNNAEASEPAVESPDRRVQTSEGPSESRSNERLTSVSPSKAENSGTAQYPSQLTSSCQQAISAFESRRISNQLARAQFLASTPGTNQPGNAYARKAFRARSESPQGPTMQDMTRSPSVPTLETAL